MEIFAKQLSDKTVVDSDGAVVGKLHNVTINFSTGDLQHLLVTPDGSPAEQQRHRSKYSSDDHGRYMIGADTVNAVKDQVVVD